MSSPSPKVFGVGMSKTGTTSLGECFEILGITPCAHPQQLHDKLLGESSLAKTLLPYMKRECFSKDYQNLGDYPHRTLVAQVLAEENYDLAIELARHFRSFEDRPWNTLRLIPLLHQTFPDSLFILTWRDPECWWRSVENWLLRSHPNDLGKRWRYLTQLKVDRIEREAFIASYEAHNSAIRDYFSGCSNFLAINFEAGEGWEELCGFLGVDTPDMTLPHLNQQDYCSPR